MSLEPVLLLPSPNVYYFIIHVKYEIKVLFGILKHSYHRNCFLDEGKNAGETKLLGINHIFEYLLIEIVYMTYFAEARN